MKNKHEKAGIDDIILGIFFRLIYYTLYVLRFVGDVIGIIARSLIVFIEQSIDIVYHLIVDTNNTLKSGFTSVIALLRSVKTITLKKRKKDEQQKKETKHKTVFAFTIYSLKTKIKYFLLGLFVALSIILAERGYVFISSLPNPKLIGNINFPVSTQMYDRNGKLLYEVYRDQNRTPISIEELPDHVIQATIAIEDKNFYNHGGISPVGGILRALKDTYITGELQGGSTITQQLVKTSLLTPEKTIERKVREAILALWAERIYSKEEILEMYFNQIPYGGSAYGVEEASKTYFNKSAKNLSLSESALLAGLTRAPSTYSPFVDPKRAQKRRNEVLYNMLDVGYITKKQYNSAIKEPLSIQPPKTFIRAPHFVFYVKALLEEKYGIRKVEEGGLRVITTLDLDIQLEAERILQEELSTLESLNVTNGAVLVTSPSTGEILAMVGSKNYFEEPYGAYNVTTALRQPGSSIKPLMYSLALERQYTAASIIDDSPVVFNIPGTKPYKPVNYDGRFHGRVPLRYALANSYNVPAVKVLNSIGVQDFISHAQKLGISTWTDTSRYGLSLTLGGGEVKMVDVAEAFGVFANYGTHVELNPILSAEDFRGNTVYSFRIEAEESVLSPQTSFIMSDILSDNFARQSAFGSRSILEIPGYDVAVKTGTTNLKRDNWTNGYNRKFMTLVWVGNNDNSPMHPRLTSGVTGAAPIWNKIMTYVLNKNVKINSDIQPPSEFSVPEGIVVKKCYFGKDEYFKIGTENRDGCSSKIFSTTPETSVMPTNYFYNEVEDFTVTPLNRQ